MGEIETVAPAFEERLMKTATFVDLAASKRTRADYTVAATCGLEKKTLDFFILNILRGRWEWPVAKEKIITEVLAQGVRMAGVEVNGFQLSAFQELVQDSRLKKVAFFPVPVEDDMTSRALLVSAKGAAGKIYCPIGVGWFEDLAYEFVNFPGRHDDIISAVTGCLELLNNFEVKEAIHRPTMVTKHSHWRRGGSR